jgi:alpha-tubulin suppressor-like RCC1 family protein
MPVLSTIGAAAARGFGWLYRATAGAGGSLYAWGYNSYGELGQGDTTNRSSPVQVGSLTTWVHAGVGSDYSAGILSDGSLWTWGRNTSGQLGLGNTTSRSSPVQVGALTNWDLISVNSSTSIALKTDGTLWAWGYNIYGQLGVGNTTNRSSPVQIGSLTSWTKISTTGFAYYTVHAIRSGGTLWAWGFGNQQTSPYVGEPFPTLNQTNYSSPVQVSSAITWAEVSSGGGHALALTTDGKLYAWGRNSFGECGKIDFNNPQYYSYVPAYGGCAGGGTTYEYYQRLSQDMGSLGPSNFPNVFNSNFSECGTPVVGVTVTEVSAAPDTQLWGFSSPVQVGSLTTWAKIAAGGGHSLAIRTDGTLWAFGYNGYGELGIGNTINRSSPVQVGALTTWAIADGGEYTSMAVRTDGTLWAWGNNRYGALGIGNTTNRSSPVQVGTATNWADSINAFSIGDYHALAIRD